MTTWTDHDLDRISTAEELELTSHRNDSSLRPYVAMWVVRVDDDVYVRSAHGPRNGWYRRAIASGTGRIRAGGHEADVEFTTADPSAHRAIDAAYYAKYDRYGPRIVGSVVGPDAADVTIRLVSSVTDGNTAGATS
jgi:hypothetical protein